jgi:hypothetical protein
MRVGIASWYRLQGSLKALFSLFGGSIKALLRLYSGSIKAQSRHLQAPRLRKRPLNIKALLRFC